MKKLIKNSILLIRNNILHRPNKGKNTLSIFYKKYYFIKN